MNQTMSEAKAVIMRSVVECQQTWPLSERALQTILISIAGDLALQESRPTTFAADVLPKPDIIGAKET